jgi:glycosyltransferase involved in cell wall biosynthesis
MRELAWAAHRTGRTMKLVTSLTPQEDPAGLPPNLISLPCVYHVTPEFYKAYTLRLPSVLRALDRIAEEEPDEIVVSTPGPVGLVGLAAARLLGIPCRGVYHTDFTRQAEQFIGDEGVAAAVEMYTRWFFKLMDEVLVPTQQYMLLLADRGLEPRRMKLFRRGVDPAFATCDPARQAELRRRLGLADAPVLLWVGRLGLEKNLGFLFDVYRRVAADAPGVRLVLVGEGPERERLQREWAGDPNVVFTGRVERAELPHYYGLADVFVFPSLTDTFGMVVLEAQSCGLPAVVTDVGGPQEIVRGGESGLVVPAGDLAGWAGAVSWYALMRRDDPAGATALREAIRGSTRNRYSWEQVLADVMGPRPEPVAPSRAAPLRPEPQPAIVP